MGLKRVGQILVIVFAILFCANSVFAAFGISPPYVKSAKLMPGSHYEQRIILSRSDPTEDVQAKITINAPEIESWISVDPGFEFVLPKGKQQVSMLVKVDVPEDAKLGNYKGYLNVRVVPAEAEGKVSIALGAQIEVDLTVGKEGFMDFLVRSVGISDSVKKPWPIKYFTKIRVSMNIENTGNVPASPGKVHLDVYNITRKNLLESNDDISLEKIKPFETKTILAEFSTKLEAGEYFGHAKIFKGDEIAEEWKAVFNIEKGTFSVKEWVILVCSGIGLLVIIAVAILIWYKKKR